MSKLRTDSLLSWRNRSIAFLDLMKHETLFSAVPDYRRTNLPLSFSVPPPYTLTLPPCKIPSYWRTFPHSPVAHKNVPRNEAEKFPPWFLVVTVLMPPPAILSSSKSNNSPLGSKLFNFSELSRRKGMELNFYKVDFLPPAGGGVNIDWWYLIGAHTEANVTSTNRETTLSVHQQDVGRRFKSCTN